MMNEKKGCTRIGWQRRRGWIAVAAALALASPPSESNAVSTFASGAVEKRLPAPFSLDEVWFYGKNGKKTFPEISLEWISVVFRAEAPSPEATVAETLDSRALEEKARQLVLRHDGFEDFFCDTNRVEEGCFFKLKQGFDEGQLLPRVLELNSDAEVDYAHPTVDLEDKTYGFFNAIDLKWKTGVDLAGMERLLGQARVWLDGGEQIYRIDLFEMPFFRALNLLAEDVHVLEASPVLVEIRPSVRVRVLLGLHGGNIGDRTPFTYTATFSENIQIDPSSLANISLRPENVQKELFEIQVEPYDFVKAIRVSPIRISGWMKFFVPGEYVIPPLKLKYTCTTCSNTQERSIETERITFRVASIMPSDQTQNRLMVPDDLLDPDDREALYHQKANQERFQAFLAFALALLTVGWIFIRNRRARRQKGAAADRRKEDILAEKLRTLLAGQPATAHWMFVEEVGTLFRQYLTERYGASQDPLGGSGQVFFDAIRERLPKGMAASVHELLKEIDTVIALEMDPYPGIERFVETMMKLVHLPALHGGVHLNSP